MKLLFDTNIFIPLEPGDTKGLEDGSEGAAVLSAAVHEGSHQIFLHPAISSDIARDRDQDRAALRRLLVRKYPELPDPPSMPTSFAAIIGEASHGTNDWVDNQLLAALFANAVDLLVSEDRGVLSKAKRLGLRDRVLTAKEAVDYLTGLQEREATPPPAVRLSKAHSIKADDPILASFREDYEGFDNWFEKCQKEHRPAFVIEASAERVAALCLFKHEEDSVFGLDGKILKICSFKVAKEYNGFRYGELLLKALLEQAFTNEYTCVFVTVFEKHGSLVELFEDFGFEIIGDRTSLGELVLVKELTCPESSDLAPLDFHIKYGPWHFRSNVSWYIVPIQPRYSDILFPETASQGSLFPGAGAFGNAIRKAYLCRSGNRSLAPGDVVAFYRSEARQGVVALGVVEKVIATSESAEISRAVARRTVYTDQEIQEMCESEALAILFRQARPIETELTAARLLEAGVINGPPQSVQQIQEKGIEWFKAQILQR